MTFAGLDFHYPGTIDELALADNHGTDRFFPRGHESGAGDTIICDTIIDAGAHIGRPYHPL